MSRDELAKLLGIREFAAREGWTLKEVADDRDRVGYNTVKSYARCSGMTIADLTALVRLTRTFDVMIEDLLKVVED